MAIQNQDPVFLSAEYARFQKLGLRLDLTRGKPAPEQLALTTGMDETVTFSNRFAEDGSDTWNYGGVQGLLEARQLFSRIIGIPSGQIIVWNNASLELMGYVLEWAMHYGLPGGAGAWQRIGPTKIVCLTPAYDRHLSLTEDVGASLIGVQLSDDGAHWEEVERLVCGDPEVRGVWLVPKNHNPTGHTLRLEEVRRIVAMTPAFPGFRWLVDDAYPVHDWLTDSETIPNIYEAFAEHGHEDRLFVFASTSKITRPGAGISCVAASPTNIKFLLARLSKRSIGPDKVRQLAHVRFLEHYPGGLDGLMAAHAAIIRPKLEAVLEVLARELGGLELATWTQPLGGYFVSLFTRDGLASRAVKVAGELGVQLTPAGAGYPGGNDPRDRHIRIAFTYPSIADLRLAMEVMAFAIRYAASQLHGERGV